MEDITELNAVQEQDAFLTEETARAFQVQMFDRYRPDQLPRVVLAKLALEGRNFLAEKRDLLVSVRRGLSLLDALRSRKSSMPTQSLAEISVVAMLDQYIDISRIAALPSDDLKACLRFALVLATKAVVSKPSKIDLINGTIDTGRRKVLEAFLYTHQTQVQALIEEGRITSEEKEQFSSILEKTARNLAGVKEGEELGVVQPQKVKMIVPRFAQSIVDNPIEPDVPRVEKDLLTSFTLVDTPLPDTTETPTGSATVDPPASVATDAGLESVREENDVPQETTVTHPSAASVEPVPNEPVLVQDDVVPAEWSASPEPSRADAGAFSIRASDGRSLTFASIGHGQASLQALATIVGGSMEDAEELSIAVEEDRAVASSVRLAFLFADIIGKPIHVTADGASLVAYPHSKKSQTIVQENRP